jgi:hypothetical protein
MPWGEAIMRGSIAASVVAYACAEYAWYVRRREAFGARAVVWTAGFALCAVHTALAFHLWHGWSHEAAVRHTAAVTAAVTGLDWGGGVYVNYAFLAVWAGDVAWVWLRPAPYLVRPAAVNAAMSAWFLFIVFNGAVVFASGPARAVGVAATLLVIWSWLRAGAWRDRIVAA